MLTAAEFLMKEPLPLHRIQEAIFEFCRRRTDVVVFGAQAINAYVAEPRMSQDVDLLSATPSETADSLARELGATFHVAVRVREIVAGKGYRVYQLRSEGNRHLADVRLAEIPFDDAIERDGIRFVAPATLAAMKVRSLARRRHSPKGATDLADLRRLLIAHPELRTEGGAVATMLDRLGAGADDFQAWRDLIASPIVSDADADEGF
jgi:hypothetical protein